jgi:hypothetical protein
MATLHSRLAFLWLQFLLLKTFHRIVLNCVKHQVDIKLDLLFDTGQAGSWELVDRLLLLFSQLLLKLAKILR